MNVTPKAFRDDMLGAFKAFWDGLHSDVPVAYQNVAFDSDEETRLSPSNSWVRVSFLGDSGQDTEGQVRYSNSVQRNHWSRTGRIFFEIYVRELDESGTDFAYDLASDVLLWLENPKSAFAVISEISAPVELGPDGTWFQMSVSADWLYFTDRAA